MKNRGDFMAEKRLLTGVVFALELTHDISVLPALLIACIVAHAFTVLVMRRSILTEKVARRGYHVSREYTVDPLEQLSVGDVMTREVITVPATLPVSELMRGYFVANGYRKHEGYPVVGEHGEPATFALAKCLSSDGHHDFRTDPRSP